MLIRGHEVFVLPEKSVTLWRYMDFTKLVSLLENQALVFPRADQFDDPYEGLLSEAAVQQLRSGQTIGELSPEQSERLIRFSEHMRKQLFISCWCASEHESAAMWKLYLSSPTGIAIRSSTDLLTSTMEASKYTIGMSMVRYIDYATTTIPFENALFPVLHKRLSFAHEHEFRAVIWSEMTDNEPLIEKQATHVSEGPICSTVARAQHAVGLHLRQMLRYRAHRFPLRSPRLTFPSSGSPFGPPLKSTVRPHTRETRYRGICSLNRGRSQNYGQEYLPVRTWGSPRCRLGLRICP